MAEIKLDFSDVSEGNRKIEDGTYEAVISSVGEDATKSGAQFMNFNMVIRNDIEQKFQNFHVWQRIFRSKTDDTYPMRWINQIAKNAQMENGKKYHSYKELMDDFWNRPVKVTVKNEKSEYNGKTYENTNIKNWAPTDFPNVQHKAKSENKDKDPFAGNSNPIDIKNSDLPF
ncbi:DUF669 domain-containing protein [Companilactobacillus alimentarius]|uniref:DUF669 domain-containing protein n=1 Tax=Companilactobacillus alimentarius TaxID=1602 RepID=UPI003D7E9CFA